MSIDLLKLPSGRSVGNCRKDAKRLAKQENIPLHEALDRIAVLNGSELSWARIIPSLGSSIPELRSPQSLMSIDDVLKVMEKFPTLNYHGFDITRSPDKPYRLLLEQNREELLKALDECNRAASFLKYVQPRKSINKKVGSSYGLKHEVERFCRSVPNVNHSEQYVANGSFICAALHLEFSFQQTDYGSPNVHFNMSSRSPVFEWSKLKRSTGGVYYRPREVERLKQLEKELGLSS